MPSLNAHHTTLGPLFTNFPGRYFISFSSDESLATICKQDMLCLYRPKETWRQRMENANIFLYNYNIITSLTVSYYKLNSYRIPVTSLGSKSLTSSSNWLHFVNLVSILSTGTTLFANLLNIW